MPEKAVHYKLGLSFLYGAEASRVKIPLTFLFR